MSDQELWGLAYWAGGFFFSIVWGDWFIRRIMEPLYEAVGPEHYGSHWSARVCGWVERALYTASWVAGRPEFIAVWLAIKAAGTWQRWGNQREIYNVFLVGNGLCILYGVVGGLFIEVSGWQKCVPVVGLVVGTLILRVCVCYELRRKADNPPAILGPKDEAERTALAYHEAGHALACWELGRCITKVSINPGEDYSGQVVAVAPNKHEYDLSSTLETSLEWAERIVILLAGPIAAKLGEVNGRGNARRIYTR